MTITVALTKNGKYDGFYKWNGEIDGKQFAAQWSAIGIGWGSDDGFQATVNDVPATRDERIALRKACH